MKLATMDIDRRAARYLTYRLSSSEEWRHYTQKLNLSWLVHNYALSGTALTPDEVSRALSNAPARHHCDNELLCGIRRVMAGVEYAHSFAQEPGELDLEAIKSFHVAISRPESPLGGRYRKNEGPMVPYLHEITRTPSISYRLRKLVEMIEEARTEYHPLRAAALVHHEFMAIWPFDKRSDTAGRLLLGASLMRDGYPPAIIHGIDRQSYYTALAKGPERMVQVVFDAVNTTLRCAESHFERAAHHAA